MEFTEEEMDRAAQEADVLLGDEAEVYTYKNHGYSVGILEKLCRLTRAEGELREAKKILERYRISSHHHARYCHENVKYPGLVPQDDRCSACEDTDRWLSRNRGEGGGE